MAQQWRSELWKDPRNGAVTRLDVTINDAGEVRVSQYSTVAVKQSDGTVIPPGQQSSDARVASGFAPASRFSLLLGYEGESTVHVTGNGPDGKRRTVQFSTARGWETLP